MKVFTALLLFAVVANIEVDAESFSLSGVHDTETPLGRRHRLQHKNQARCGEDGDDNSDVPQPEPDHHTESPELDNDPNETGSDGSDNERPQPPHRRPHRRSHRH